MQYGRPRFDPWVRKIPRRKKWQPTPSFVPGESHGWRSLVGYSPWGRKESTWLSDFTHSLTHQEMTCETWKFKQRQRQGWFELRILELGLDDAEPERKTHAGEVGSLDQTEGFWWPDGSSLNLLTWMKKSRTHPHCNKVILSWRHLTMNICR